MHFCELVYALSLCSVYTIHIIIQLINLLIQIIMLIPIKCQNEQLYNITLQSVS